MRDRETIIKFLYENNISEIKKLIEEDKKLIRKTLNARKGLIFWNALYNNMSPEMAKLLLEEHIVDMNLIDSHGFNCLAHCKSIDMAKLFIQAGADVHHRNKKNQDITHYLVRLNENKDVLQFFNTVLKKDTLPEKILPDEKAFWGIVNQAIKKGHDDERLISVETVKILDEKLLPEIIQFELTYKKISRQYFTPEIWAGIYNLQGGCSDDDFLFYKIPWLASLGEKAFQNIINSPKNLWKYWNKNKKRLVNYSNIDCERISIAGEVAYRRKTGKSDFTDVVQKYGELENKTVNFDIELFHKLINR